MLKHERKRHTVRGTWYMGSRNGLGGGGGGYTDYQLAQTLVHYKLGRQNPVLKSLYGLRICRIL